MTTAGSSNDVSNNSNNPFVKVWLWFRKMLAKIWVSGYFIEVISSCTTVLNTIPPYLQKSPLAIRVS
jgi:hypothetical protein